MTVKTKGLVIREQKVAESDCVITVLTDSYGVIRVWTKGIFNPKSRNSAARLFCFSEFTLFKSRDRYSLNSADLIEGFFNLRRDITSLSLCSYFSQVVSSLLDEYAETADILSLVLNCFHLAAGEKKPLGLIKSCFEFRLSALLGYTPLLDSCEVCESTEFAPDGLSRLDLQSGTLYCDACAAQRPTSIRITPAVLRAMRHIISAPAEKLFSFSLGGENAALLAQVTEKYLITQCGRSFPALDFYKGL